MENAAGAKTARVAFGGAAAGILPCFQRKIWGRQGVPSLGYLASILGATSTASFLLFIRTQCSPYPSKLEPGVPMRGRQETLHMKAIG